MATSNVSLILRHLFILLLFAVPTSFQAQEINLDSCYIWTRSNFPSLKNKKLNIEANALRIRSLHTNYLPKLELTAQGHYQSDVPHMEGGISLPTGRVDFPTPPLQQFKVTLDVQQTIWDGGVTKRIKNLELNSLLTQNQKVEVELYQLNNQVNDLYFTILLLQKQVEQLNNMRRSLEQTLTSVKSGVKNGVLTLGSEDELQVSIYEIEQKEVQLSKGLDASFSILSELTGKELNGNKKLHIPTTQSQTEIKRPELELFQMQKNSLSELSSVSSSKRMPKLGAFAQLGYGNPGLNMLKDEWKEFYIIGAKLQWTIWDWGNTKREQQEYTIKQRLVENNEQVFLRNVEINRTKEQNKQAELQSLIEKDSKIIELRERIRKRSESQIKNGIITSSEYVKKLTEETQAKILKEIHELELLKSKVSLNTISGHAQSSAH